METERSERLESLRKTLGLTQTEFAEKMGLSCSAISMIEQGRNPLGESKIRLISLVFGVNEAWLRDGTGDMLNAAGLKEDEERRLLDDFRAMLPATRNAFLDHVKNLLAVERAILQEAQKQPELPAETESPKVSDGGTARASAFPLG
ncbi:MAG: helix-turn-helix domain-containing protein [Spirochaetota bacterium]|jgi:transcriptional regulator with XRE-family HTH domain|nr:helix-turn-helix domain-containing protein [Spirochaetota bacterium]